MPHSPDFSDAPTAPLQTQSAPADPSVLPSQTATSDPSAPSSPSDSSGQTLPSDRIAPSDLVAPSEQVAPSEESSVLVDSLRFATFNVSMFRNSEGALATELKNGSSVQGKAVAEIIQRTQPDVVLLNEFDYDATGESARVFANEYLGVSQGNQPAASYPFIYTAASNTGVQSGADLNGDGEVGGPQDAYGFGSFPGQYGMVLYSKYPIDTTNVRTFQKLKWSAMPDNLMPVEFYGALAAKTLRLPSKSLWDVPLLVKGKTVHVIASHPTPPAFDGPEERNVSRNHDEIRLIKDYVTGGKAASYITDNKGVAGGLKQDASFVILGDLNAQPQSSAAIDALRADARVQDPSPASAGAINASGKGALMGDFLNPMNSSAVVQLALAATSTAQFSQGPMRVDYVLPSQDAEVKDAGVFWPAPSEAASSALQTSSGKNVSDHHLVWVDIALPFGT